MSPSFRIFKGPFGIFSELFTPHYPSVQTELDICNEEPVKLPKPRGGWTSGTQVPKTETRNGRHFHKGGLVNYVLRSVRASNCKIYPAVPECPEAPEAPKTKYPENP